MRFLAVPVLLSLAATGTPVVAQPGVPNDATGAPARSMHDGYLLGAGDQIQVTLFGEPQNTVVSTRIKEDGTIILPFIGQITARDHTARQLADDIAARLKAGGYFVKPIVSVDVTQYVSNAVTVLGNVATPGLYPLDQPQTVGMAIARAGGTRADGADFVLLKRPGDGEEHRILLSDFSGPWSEETRLRAGDTLYVPNAPILYVYGQVNTPGAVTIKTGMTVRQALARAGGPTLAGSEHKLSIYRDGKTIKRVKLESEVQPGDTLYVHERLF